MQIPAMVDAEGEEVSIRPAKIGEAVTLKGIRPKIFMSHSITRHFGYAQLRGSLAGWKKIEGALFPITELTLKIEREHSPLAMSEIHDKQVFSLLPKCDTLVTIWAIRHASVIVRCSKNGNLMDFPRCIPIPPAKWLAAYCFNFTAYRTGAFDGENANKKRIAQHIEEYKELTKEDNEEQDDAELWDW